VWTRGASERKPKVGDTTAELEEGELRLGWSVEASGEQESEALAQWSADRGRTWRGLGAGLRGGSAVLDARWLPAGRVAVRLLVSDGFYTAVSRSMTVTVPRRPPDVSVLSPRDGQTFVSGSPMRLWGVATDAKGEPVSDEQARWVVDGGEATGGLDVFVEAAPPGEHRATLTVQTRDGTNETSVAFVTVEVPEERDED
jgi:hypothetical protein